MKIPKRHSGLGSEHPLNDRLQQIMIALFFFILVIDSLSLFFFKHSSILFNAFSFPILILPAAVFWIVGVSLITKSTGKVLVREAKFTDSGVYSLVRHPMYLGVLMFLLGFLFICASLAAFVTWIIFFIIANKMATYEENDLTRILGKKYVNYKNRVPKWFPGL